MLLQRITWEPFYKLKSDKNDKFVIKDTLPDGNCQFRAISEAMKCEENKLNHKQLRKLIAEYILESNDDSFRDIVNHYRIEKTNGEFIGKWDPFKVKTKTQFARQIKKYGFHFQGDNMTLAILSPILKVDFVIVSQNGTLPMPKPSGTFITELSQNHPKFIMLYYTGDHYQTIGIKKKGIRKVITIIERINMPNILRLLIDKYYFVETEIRNYYEECKSGKCPFTLPVLYKRLKSFTPGMAKIINELISLPKTSTPIRKTSLPKTLLPKTLLPKTSTSIPKTSLRKTSLPQTPRRIRKTSHK